MWRSSCRWSTPASPSDASFPRSATRSSPTGGGRSLRLVEDTSGGIHDTLIAACDRWRYELLGCAAYHDNCTDNLRAALAELGFSPPETPSPLNLFMNIPVTDGNAIDVLPPVSTPGSFVTLQAEMDCLVAFSACPQDMVPINGLGMTPTAAHFEVLG